VIGLVGWLFVTFVAATVGALASLDAATFYTELALPTWAPPAWLFGPVWSLLYALMGVAAWLIWREHGSAGARRALRVYLVQLAANALWSWLFFGWRLGGPAFAEVLVLFALIGATIVLFGQINRVAACLLVPYIAWVSFAAALNFAIWRMNPTLL
jgi:tryptophan-rich sensory protein